MDNNTSIQLASNDEILIYQSQDGVIKIDVLFENETVWLNIEQMSTLFGKSRSTINEHILHIYEEKELKEVDTMRKIGNSDFSYCINFVQFFFFIYMKNVFVDCRTRLAK